MSALKQSILSSRSCEDMASVAIAGVGEGEFDTKQRCIDCVQWLQVMTSKRSCKVFQAVFLDGGG